MNKGLMKKHCLIRFNYLVVRNLFLKPEKPLLKTYDIEELPEEGTISETILESRRTYTKWFNPSNFDPRTPDYFNTIRNNWDEDVTREDIGSSNHKYIII